MTKRKPKTARQKKIDELVRQLRKLLRRGEFLYVEVK